MNAFPSRRHRLVAIGFVTVILVAGTVGLQATSWARQSAHVTLTECRSAPWTSPTYQAGSTPAALGAEVLTCLKLEFPKSYLHDEVGIVALVHDRQFQNINEFGLTSTVQRQLAYLGIPPISLEDGPGGLQVEAHPEPTLLPNELALGATFDPSLASAYGNVLGTEAHEMGYDGVQAPLLNLLRVPGWGRAFESFGESPVLAGDMGASEAVAIADAGEIPVLKHFGPYSQDTDRHSLDQLLSERTYQEVYIRPFVIALNALQPLLTEGHHAVGIMCSYGNVNATRACRSSELSEVLGHLGVNALVRSDLDVWVRPTELLLHSIDLIKPMASQELTAALGDPVIDKALDQAVTEVFTTEFADGLVNGRSTLPVFHELSSRTVTQDAATANEIEARAAVLLKDDGILPLAHGAGPIVVIGDQRVRGTCSALAATLASDLSTQATCTDPRIPLPHAQVLGHLPFDGGKRTFAATATFTPPQSGAYVAAITSHNTTQLTVDGRTVVSTSGASEFDVQRTALVTLQEGRRYVFRVHWLGVGPSLTLYDEQPLIDADVQAARGARAAIVLAYDLSREGMDRSSLALPFAQNAVISAVAGRAPTVVLLASDGAVTMPWLNEVHGLLEVWSPTGMVYTDASLQKFVGAYGELLDGTSDPSGKLPETFPEFQQDSPMAIASFWPGIDDRVNLDRAPDGGLGIGYDWYRQAGWPVLFPFGYGLSYTTYQLVGGEVTDTSAGLGMTVSVRDTGGVAGTEVVQAYADWPSGLGEPPTQLVGFEPVTFSAHDAATGAVRHVTIPISPDALSVYAGSGLAVAQGSYCLEAATYDGDPHAWSSGPEALGPGANGGIAGPSTQRLSQGSCPS